MKLRSLLSTQDAFVPRHLGPRDHDIASMLDVLGLKTLEELGKKAVPEDLWNPHPSGPESYGGEAQTLAALKEMASQNGVWRSYIGVGYYGTTVPPVIQRNVLENPGWYTQYTPYQAEISQGRLEALLNFQTMISDLTGLPIANASLLDEATAAAEAITMCRAKLRNKRGTVIVASDCHPQTIGVIQTRAEPQGITVQVRDVADIASDAEAFGDDVFAVLLQYPATDGRVHDLREIVARANAAGAASILATDLLALTLFEAPGAFGADVAIGSSQRFGVPMGYGGPHAAFMSCTEDYRRLIPGRIVGVSIDADGKPAYRLALQTREQHIRRDKATSNICTAQVLLAIMASMYAVYHGPTGLKNIAERVHLLTSALRSALETAGHNVQGGAVFDTLRVHVADADATLTLADEARINLRAFDDGSLGISLDETVTADDLAALAQVFGVEPLAIEAAIDAAQSAVPASLVRQTDFLTHPVFARFHAEHEMLRYLNRLQARDLSLTTSMIPLGSCTMKLNATSEMIPITWPEFANLHPFAPLEQTEGYRDMFADLETWLAELTGFADTSLQPNAGSQGEYAGLMVIRAYHESRGDRGRVVCLIPNSAHGTNPASAVTCGMKVVPVKCDESGNIDVEDLRAKAEKYADTLAALMVTYPSTHGVFEASIREVCEIVHNAGGQVYLDGANMNAQVGLCRPGDYGADVCHLNLHKTFCIPHGGGGPGMGPICVAEHLVPYLPGHPVVDPGGDEAIGPVSAAPWGSAAILPIPWMYIAAMGADGLRKATQVAILNANYMVKRLEGHYDVLYRGPGGWVAHEFILDCRGFKQSSGIEVDDIAKRLMDYGFHAPTMSFPVPGTLMVEPTESESRAELDRFVEAMLSIREEIAAIERGESDRDDNPLKHAPHPAHRVAADTWDHAYTREQAAYPVEGLRAYKYWPPVARVDNAWGDRNLMCTCPSMDEYEE